MHPFCCVSTVSEHSPAKPSSQFAELAMAPVTSLAAAARSDSTGRVNSHINNNGNHHNHHHHHQSYSHNQCQNHTQNHSTSNSLGNSDYGRLSQRTTAAAAAVAAAEALARAPSMREQPVDVKINDLVGNGVSGILYKWVNYGKGWRPRWFVLQDGVLSYYKIHGPDKIIVSQETEKGSKVIGEESLRRISRQKNGNSQQHRRKPFGEIHLKVLFQFRIRFLAFEFSVIVFIYFALIMI